MIRIMPKLNNNHVTNKMAGNQYEGQLVEAYLEEKTRGW